MRPSVRLLTLVEGLHHGVALAALVVLPASCETAPQTSTKLDNTASPQPPPVVTPPTASSDANVAHLQAAASAPSHENGATEPERPVFPDKGNGHVFAKTRYVWVRYEPRFGSGWTGFLWLGGWATLRDPQPVHGGPGCPAWYAVEPRGYVCVDGVNATIDPEDATLKALLPYAPRLDQAYPHHYGESRDAQRYLGLPSQSEQRGREGDLRYHLARVAGVRAGGVADGLLAGVDLSPASDEPLNLPELPPSLREDRARLRYTSTVAWSRDVRGDNRDFLLSADFRLVPKDRVAPYPVSDFHGLRLGTDATLPLAFFRGKDRPKYAKQEGGTFAPTGQSWARLAWVELTGKSEKSGSALYLETKEPGLFVDAADAVLPTPRELTPWGARVGSNDTTGRAPPGRGTWIEASVLGGWLIAYEGTTAVYATMISPGRGGIPEKGKDPLETASTPTGVFPLTGKFATATMVAPNEFIHSDVPWAQNFHGPHAIHGAYWHDRWGEKMSAGCVNVSLTDGRWLFYWTEPALPDAWHGVRLEPTLGPSTTFIVHP